ncbi:hypothetical protein DOY81_004021 [Sarcophaga bullata]|nr:hypothetical protein DOY81_004021 [Sarcophaga bullata]
MRERERERKKRDGKTKKKLNSNSKRRECKENLLKNKEKKIAKQTKQRM